LADTVQSKRAFFGTSTQPEVVAVTTYARRCLTGTSLVEALAAITVLSIGALGIVATGIDGLRLETSAGRRSRAASAISNRLELVHSAKCVSSAGTDSTLGVSATWRTTAVDSIQEVLDSVLVTDGLAARPLTEVVQSAAPC
jgi:Tfp pilus assembly protein PilV